MARAYYNDVINLGFKDCGEDDKVYETMYGFPYAIVSKELVGGCTLYYYKEDGRIELQKVSHEHNVVSAMDITLEEATLLVNYFSLEEAH